MDALLLPCGLLARWPRGNALNLASCALRLARTQLDKAGAHAWLWLLAVADPGFGPARGLPVLPRVDSARTRQSVRRFSREIETGALVCWPARPDDNDAGRSDI